MTVFDPNTKLAKLRAKVTDLMPDTAIIRRSTLTSDGFLGQVATEQVVATDVPCRIATAKSSRTDGRLEVIGGRELELADWTVTVPVGTDVAPGDTVSAAGHSMTVLSVSGGSFSVQTRLLCKEVR